MFVFLLCENLSTITKTSNKFQKTAARTLQFRVENATAGQLAQKFAERFVCVSVYALFDSPLEPYEASLC